MHRHHNITARCCADLYRWSPLLQIHEQKQHNALQQSEAKLRAVQSEMEARVTELQVRVRGCWRL